MTLVSLIRRVAKITLCCCFTGSVLAAAPADPSLGRPLQSDIAAQPLPQALQEFISQTGLQLA